MKHIHHIIPKYMGGTDDPSNLVILTVEEHAEEHRKLYEQHGCWQDKLAWQGLSGMMKNSEIIMEILKSPKSDDHKRKISEAHKGKKKPWLMGNKNASGNKGRKNTEEHNSKIGASKIGKKRMPFSDEWKKALKDAKAKQPIVECPHCKVSGRGSNMTRYHFSKCKKWIQ